MFLPVFLPWLGALPGAATPPNQAGTFAFSLDRELEEILGADRQAGALVVAHLDYLHQGRFPGMSELTKREREAVWAAPLTGVADLSLDWQYPAAAGDPLGLSSWKVRHLLDALRAAVARTGVLVPEKRNRLVVFSDHGPRVGVDEGKFGIESYFRVPLVAFGITVDDPDRAVSLVEIPVLLELEPSGPSRIAREPVVEYANATPAEWARLVLTSRPLDDGGIEHDTDVLLAIGDRLKAYRPASRVPSYDDVPVSPAPERRSHTGPLAAILARLRRR